MAGRPKGKENTSESIKKEVSKLLSGFEKYREGIKRAG